jgi:putative ABC transport system permease protein
VELKAVEPAYPLYGRVETAPTQPLDALLADRGEAGGALVESRLLERLGIGVGDTLVIGRARFVVSGVLVREPDRSVGLVTLGPRVLVAAPALERTGLVQIGSRVRYRTLARLPADLTARAAVDDLARAIGDPTVRIAAFDESQPGLRKFFTQLAAYLGLVGLASLLVGGVGITSTVATFLRRQLATIAILKCLGAGSRVLLATYLIQTLTLALLASVVGAAVGVAVQPLFVRALAPFAPFALETRWDVGTPVRGIVLGLLAALLCALWPLLAIRAVPPSLILRRDVDASAWRARRPWAAAVPIVAGLTCRPFSPTSRCSWAGRSATASPWRR